MKKQLYFSMLDREKSYWWDVARRNLVHHNIAASGFNSKSKLLDAGCGPGTTLSFLGSISKNSLGFDRSPYALKICQSRGLFKVKKANFEKKIPSASSYFDGLVCLETLEHVKNDTVFLLEIHRVLKRGGKFFLTVPAYQFLWGQHDIMIWHKRRYRRSQLAKRLKLLGFKIKKASYFYSFLFPAAVFVKVVNFWKRKKTHDAVELSPVLNKIVLALCHFEHQLINHVSMPFGTSILIIAEKQ